MKLEMMKLVKGFTWMIGFLADLHVQTASTDFYMWKLVDNNSHS